MLNCPPQCSFSRAYDGNRLAALSQQLCRVQLLRLARKEATFLVGKSMLHFYSADVCTKTGLDPVNWGDVRCLFCIGCLSMIVGQGKWLVSAKAAAEGDDLAKARSDRGLIYCAALSCSPWVCPSLNTR
jgi:hypothetical protein